MDRIPRAESATNTTKILQAISQIGDYELIQDLLEKDLDGTMLILEKSIPSNVIEDILV